jgi:hypothetical protein
MALNTTAGNTEGAPHRAALAHVAFVLLRSPSCARGVELRPRARARFATSVERVVELVSMDSRRCETVAKLRDNSPGGDVSRS